MSIHFLFQKYHPLLQVSLALHRKSFYQSTLLALLRFDGTQGIPPIHFILAVSSHLIHDFLNLYFYCFPQLFTPIPKVPSF